MLKLQHGAFLYLIIKPRSGLNTDYSKLAAKGETVLEYRDKTTFS